MDPEAFISTLAPHPRKLVPGERLSGLISSYEVTKGLVIYVQPVEYDGQIESIGSTLESLPPQDHEADMLFLNNAQAGVRVLAKYSVDESWYRAIILELQDEHTADEQVTVFFMDWGNTEKIKMEDIRIIPRGHEFHKLPAYAFKCMIILEPGQKIEEMNRFLNDATSDGRDINFEVLGEAPKFPNCYNIRIQDLTIPGMVKVEVEDKLVSISGAEAMKTVEDKSYTQMAENKSVVDSAPGISEKNVGIDKPEDQQVKVAAVETQIKLKQLVQDEDLDCPNLGNMGVKGVQTAVSTSDKLDSSLTCIAIPGEGVDKAVKEATCQMVESEPVVESAPAGEASEQNVGSSELTLQSCSQMAENETVVDSAPRFAEKNVGIDKPEDEQAKVTQTQQIVDSSLICIVGNAEAEPSKFIPDKGIGKTIKEIAIPIIEMVESEPIVDFAGEASEQNVGSGEPTDKSCTQMAENETVVGSEPKYTVQNVGINKPGDKQAKVTKDQTQFNLIGRVEELGLGDGYGFETAGAILERVDSPLIFYAGDADPTEFIPEQGIGNEAAFINWVEKQPAVDSVKEDAGYYRGMMKSFDTVHTLTAIIKEQGSKLKALEKSNHELMMANSYYRIELTKFQGKPVPKPVRGLGRKEC